MHTKRQTVDLSAYPDLVVIYLGMKAHDEEGSKTLASFAHRIEEALAPNPDGLLAHEDIAQSSTPPAAIFRQYWRDFSSLEAWVRIPPHRDWWKDFRHNPQGTEFWHETYFIRGGMEAIFDEVIEPTGLMKFAPLVQARGPMFSSRQRLKLEGLPPVVDGASESDLYKID